MGKVELSISGNSRLLVGVAGAVNHVGEAAGLGDKARGDLVAAVEQACHEALDQAADKQARVALSLEVLPGKIEAVLQYPTAPRAVRRLRTRAVGQARRCETRSEWQQHPPHLD